MRAFPRTPHAPASIWTAGAVVALLLLLTPGTGTAQAADPRIEAAQQKRVELQERLDTLAQRLDALDAEVAEAESELASLRARAEDQREEAREADAALAERVRESYIRGNVDPTLVILTSRSPGEAQEQARLLGVLADRSRAEIETATAARTRTVAAAETVEHVAETVRERKAEAEEVRGEVTALLDEAKVEEQRVRQVVAAEQAERERRERERRERLAADQASRARASGQRADRSSRSGAAASAAAPAPTSGGGVACPVGQPRTYSDTWGAARSGGRAHKGTDILAPRGTPIYAYESGTISRTSSNSLGGISLYLRGDSGTVYYYTHLQGYVGGVGPGQRVGAGQQIAYNGDTGNARGIPHLHFEVAPGGGGAVNPYPYVRRACG